jgi:hypothetical protein
VGHDVWRVSYRDGAAWKWLTQHSKLKAAATFHIKTDALRYAERQQAKILAFTRAGQMAELSARSARGNRITVSSDNVEAFELRRIDEARQGPFHVEIDGITIDFDAKEPLRLVRGSAGWKKDHTTRYAKRARLEGPIHDAFLEPLVFSYGTRDPALTRASFEVADRFAKSVGGDVEYTLLPDSAISDSILAASSLVLVGNAQSHSLLAKMADRLPIKLSDGKLRLGQAEFTGRELGSMFVYPNPLNPEHYVVVILAADAAGIWRALSLPKLLPDFIIYDDGIANSAGQQVLARGYARSAGFFTNQWRAPERICDPLAPVDRCDD